MKMMLYSIAATLMLAAAPALAQNTPTATQGTSQTFGCIAPGADGKPSRKLSSEDVCPMYAFMRDDCNRLRANPNAEPFALAHCGVSAEGRARDEGLTTGSIAPLPTRRRR